MGARERQNESEKVRKKKRNRISCVFNFHFRIQNSENGLKHFAFFLKERGANELTGKAVWSRDYIVKKRNRNYENRSTLPAPSLFCIQPHITVEHCQQFFFCAQSNFCSYPA